MFSINESNIYHQNVKNKIKEWNSNLDTILIEILLKVNLNNMASFPFGLKMWYNIIICYKRKYSFSYKLKGTTCKILNVQEGRRERRNERSDHFLHSFVETVLESFWITWYMQIRFDLLTYFKTKIPTCYLALNFHLSSFQSLSLSLSLSDSIQ